MSECTIASSEIERLEISDDIPDKLIYKALPVGEFIRVLKLQPGETDQDIRCSLEIVGIEDSKATYEAISYVWGDAKNTVNIWCNGLRVPITASLADALRNFRRTSKPRVLWADALCINQKDDREKGHQVERMGEVYTNAKRTLVWLDRDNQDIAEDAFALMCETNTYLADSFFQADQNFYKMRPFAKPYPICMEKERWRGVAQLFEFPWFRRVWTVQEAAIAKECRLYWGSVSIDIADVLEMCVWVSQKQDFRKTIRNVVGQINYLMGRNIPIYLHYNTHRPERWQQSRTGLTYFATRSSNDMFVSVLQAARYLEASDHRDHIYAFLGCPAATDSLGHALVETDYTSSIDDLNLRLACVLMDAAEAPFVLSAVTHDSRDRLMNGMHPSWVPKWHVAGKYRLPLTSPSIWFNAGGSRERFTATQYGKNCLTVCAYTFDTVIWKSKRIELDQATLNPTYVSASGLDGSIIDTLWDDVMQSSSQFGITVRQVDFLRTLMVGYAIGSGFSAMSDRRQQSVIDAYRKIISVARPSDAGAVAMSPRHRYDAAMLGTGLRLLFNASIFLTRDARIGIAPLGDLVEVGDVCCIIVGAAVPFLLTPAREGRHKLVGECYINGVMKGEIMQQFDESDLNEHRIVLE